MHPLPDAPGTPNCGSAPSIKNDNGKGCALHQCHLYFGLVFLPEYAIRPGAFIIGNL